MGDQWTFVALDPDTKLIPAYRVGKRDLGTAMAFLCDLPERLTNRIQLSSDALAAYVSATEEAFGTDVDYGQAVKFYEADPIGPGRYSPPKVVRSERTAIVGNPRSSLYLNQLGRAPKLDHENVDAPVHAVDQRLLQEGREPPGGGCATLRTLQLREAAPDHPVQPGHGGWREQASVVYGGTG